MGAGAGKAQPDFAAALYASWGGELFNFNVSLLQCTDYSCRLTLAKVILLWEIGKWVSSFFSIYF